MGDGRCKDGLSDYVYEIYRIADLYHYFREAGNSHLRELHYRIASLLRSTVLASGHDGEGTTLVVASDSNANTLAVSPAVPSAPIDVHQAEAHVGTLTERCCATSYHVCYNHLGWKGTLTLQCKHQNDADNYKLCSKYTHCTSNPLGPVQNKSAPAAAYFFEKVIFNLLTTWVKEHPDMISGGRPLPIDIDTESLLLVKRRCQAIILTHKHEAVHSIIFQIGWTLKGWMHRLWSS